jgi:hypothetical protein
MGKMPVFSERQKHRNVVTRESSCGSAVYIMIGLRGIICAAGERERGRGGEGEKEQHSQQGSKPLDKHSKLYF